MRNIFGNRNVLANMQRQILSSNITDAERKKENTIFISDIMNLEERKKIGFSINYHLRHEKGFIR